MIEPALASGLAALAVGSGMAAAAVARDRRPRRRWSAPVRPWHLGSGLAVALAVALPIPAVVAVPTTLVGAFGARRMAHLSARASRRRALEREVPQLLDVLAAAASAGLSAVAGIRAAVGTLRGPLGEEFRASLETVDLGGPWRSELTRLSERLDLPELRRAIAILVRSATLGTALADATRELAADVREARRAAVAERARAAPVKMLFPLVVLVLPAFLLLTVVPVLLTPVRSIG